MPQKMQLLEISKQFSGGLMKDSGFLSFPETGTLDELNMTIEQDGSRRRRKGVEILVQLPPISGDA